MIKKHLDTPEEVIKVLKEGKVVKSKNVKYRLIDGIICSFHEEYGRKLWTVCNSICEYEKPYIDEPEPLKIEVGKFYKTRDGRKAWVVSRQQDEHYPYIIAILDEVDAYAVTKDGRFYDDKPYEFDLVGQWDGDN